MLKNKLKNKLSGKIKIPHSVIPIKLIVKLGTKKKIKRGYQEKKSHYKNAPYRDDHYII